MKKADIGLIGLGIMGHNLLLNMADHGFSVVGYDGDASKVEVIQKYQKDHIFGAMSVKDFISKIRSPRAIMLMVPAGSPVDSVIEEISPYLEKGDILIDGGNSYFKDTDLRGQHLAKQGISFFGVGISGGEEGARYGASIMPGGPFEAYDRIRPILDAIAAKVNEDTCSTYLGPHSAGHFVKMVHNGIEYAIMQLISETYDFMKRGLKLSDDKMHEIYSDWNHGVLNSYLLEITADIFKKKDEKTGKRLIEVILDVAKQNGTGMWTSQCAMELRVPAFTIDIAVGMRNLSMQETERKEASEIFKQTIDPLCGKQSDILALLNKGLYTAFIIVYAQGMAILSEASQKYNYQYDLEAVARIWRGGCIIRSTLLEDIRKAYKNNPKLSNLILDPFFSKSIKDRQKDLREIVSLAIQNAIPFSGFITALTYLDAFQSSWLPVNLIQAQRDYFGAHTYERIDSKGTYHTIWNSI